MGTFFFSEKELYMKFLKLKPNVNWKEQPIYLEYFTEDAAILLSDIDIQATLQAHNLHCDIFIHPGKYFLGTSSGFAFQKDSPLKEIIDFQLLKFFQTGFMTKLSQKYLKTELEVCEPPVRELDFKATFFSFAILGCGVVIALIVFTAEIIRFYSEKRFLVKKYFVP